MAKREQNCKWYFADQPLGGQDVGPNNAMAQNFKKHPYASLVRESIQNSLDAVADKSKPVRVVYSFKNMRWADYPEFYKIKDHIAGCLDYYINNQNAKDIYGEMLKRFDEINSLEDSLRYIRISDFNTKGMKYDENKTDSPFYAFVRSAGVSAKETNSAGGSFGFGKAAYFQLSPISTIIVSTCTTKEDRYFEGVSSLCTHTFEGVKKMSVGYYDDNNGMPICDETRIPVQFRRADPGTDINILGFNGLSEIEAKEEMKQAVLRNFWLAIYKGRLEVEIDNDIFINKVTLSNILEATFPDDEDNSKKVGFDNPRPYFDAVRFAGSSKQYVKIEDNLPRLGHVEFYVNKKKGASDKIAYFRELQMLVYSKRNKTNFGMYGVFYCDDPTGNSYLRRLENPAHDEWSANNWKTEGKNNKLGRQIIKLIDTHISSWLSELFASKDKTCIDIKGLEEFLYIPRADEDDDLDLDCETPPALNGEPTGNLVDEGNLYTTDIPQSDNNPTIASPVKGTSMGHVLINKQTKAKDSLKGKLLSGHGDSTKKTKEKGIERPGDAKDKREEDENGTEGIYATPIYVPYRTFSQVENGQVCHYIILHPEKEVGKVRLHFFAIGEDSDEELQIAETNVGIITGNVIQDVKLSKGRIQLRVRFADKMKHSIKLSAEEYEVQ